jgi:CcmD family protein
LNAPSSINVYLIAAYVVVWVIHSLYAFGLVSRSRRLKRESRELQESQRS